MGEENFKILSEKRNELMKKALPANIATIVGISIGLNNSLNHPKSITSNIPIEVATQITVSILPTKVIIPVCLYSLRDII
jgi:hypothetical protein